MKRLFYLILIISLFNLSHGFELFIDKTSLGVSTKPEAITLTIKNSYNFEEVFLISVFPQESYGVKSFYTDRVWIKPNSEAEVKIYFVAPKCIEEIRQVFKVTVYPFSSPENKITQDIIVSPKEEATICISKFNLNKNSFNPNEVLEIYSSIKNLARSERNVEVSVEVFGEIYSKSISISPLSEELVKFSIPIDKSIKPQEYSIKLVLKENNNVLDFRDTKFLVNKVVDLEYSQENSVSIFSVKTKIKIANRGNDYSNEFYYTINLPFAISPFFYSINKFAKEGNLYKWLVPRIAPNETYVIEYKIILYPIWIIAILIVISIIFIYSKYYTIFVVKRSFVESREEKDWKITIEVKNARRRKLTNVVLIDKVPSIFKISTKFDFAKPEIIRKPFGFELIWDIGTLEQDEERVFSYRIKPIVEIVGKFKLPRAILKFKEGRKEKVIVLSKSVTI